MTGIKRGSRGSTKLNSSADVGRGRKKNNTLLSKKGILALSKDDRKFGSQLGTEHGSSLPSTARRQRR